MCTWNSACYTTLFITFPGYDVTILSPIVSKDWYCDLRFCGSFTLFIGAAIVVSEWFLLVVMWMPLSDECKRTKIITSKSHQRGLMIYIIQLYQSTVKRKAKQILISFPKFISVTYLSCLNYEFLSWSILLNT